MLTNDGPRRSDCGGRRSWAGVRLLQEGVTSDARLRTRFPARSVPRLLGGVHDLLAMAPNVIDTIRALFTYATAMLIGVGGLWAVVTQPMAPDTKTIVGAFIGSALTFLFGQEVQTRTARQANTASALGASQNAGNGVTPPITEHP